jgi:hypothetical protein
MESADDMSKARIKKKSKKRSATLPKSRLAMIERLFGTVNKELLDSTIRSRPPYKPPVKDVFLERVEEIVQKALRDRHKINPANRVVRSLASEASGAEGEN